MGWFSREKKGSMYSGMASMNSADHLLGQLIEGVLGSRTKSGVSVTEEKSLRLGAVWACVTLLSDTIGTLPINILRKEGDTTVRDTDHPLNDLLCGRPNAYMSPTDFKGGIVSSLCTKGAYWALKGKDTKGRTVALNPINGSEVDFSIKNGSAIHSYKGQAINPDDLLFIKGFSVSHDRIMSPIQYARENIGLAISADTHGANFFSNGGHPSMTLEMPQGVTLTDPQRERMEETLKEKYQGSDNAFKIMLLEGGHKASNLGLNNKDAQYIEARKMSISDIARIYRVPPHMIGDLDRSTNNNIEHQALDFVKYSLNPYFKRIEEWLQISLFTPAERGVYRIKFNPEALLRGDLASRSEFYSKLTMAGVMTINEARAKEDLKPIDGGDQILVQGQMTNINQLGNDDVTNKID